MRKGPDMTTESDFIEPEYETPEADAAGVSLPRRVAQIIFYGGSAAALGLMLLVYASPAFASRVGEALPQGLMDFAGGDGGGCGMSGGCGMAARPASACPSMTACPSSVSDAPGPEAWQRPLPSRTAAMTPEAGCCSSLSRSALMASEGPSACGGCPSQGVEEPMITKADEDAAEPAIPDATEVFAGGL